MAKGKIISIDDAGGTIRSKTKVFEFATSDLVEGFTPAVDATVSFDRDGGRARKVRPPEPTMQPEPAAQPKPAPSTRGPARPRPGRSQPAARPATPARPAAPASISTPTRPRPWPDPPTRGNSFVNPYNFVPLNSAGVRRRQIGDVETRMARLSLPGTTVRLTVDLTFETVASVSPERLPDRPDGIKQWGVRCDHDGRPWIPGASLKGALRTVFEILSSSCLSQFDHATAFSWRPIAPAQAGFLVRQDGGWFIEPADDIRVRPRQGATTGDRWQGTAADRGRGGMKMLYEDRGPRAQSYTGEWVISDVAEDSTKKWQRAFTRSGRAKLPVDERVIKAADAAHQARHKKDAEAEGRRVPAKAPGPEVYRKLYRPYGDMNDKEWWPVWYRADRRDGGNVRELGPVALFRRPFTDSDDVAVTLKGILERHSQRYGLDDHRGYLACGDHAGDGLCSACRLFGTVLGTGQGASGWQGRVRFGSARSGTPLPPDSKPVVLKPAGQPHPSAQTFYLWDPDRHEDPAAAAFGNEGALLRGRKLYWHRRDTEVGDVVLPESRQDEIAGRDAADRQLQAKELIPARTRFRFEVECDSVEDAELGLLVLTLDPARLGRLLGFDGEPLHKIGGGKPLGMGSARLKIVKAEVIDTQRRYGSLSGEDTPSLDGQQLESALDAWAKTAKDAYGLSLDRADVSALLSMLDWNAVPPELLTYPPGPDPATEHESFRWFMEFAAKDRRTGQPAPNPKTKQGPDPLRTVAEIAGPRRYQWRWDAPARSSSPGRRSHPSSPRR